MLLELYLSLAVLGLRCRDDLSTVSAIGGCSLVAVVGRLIAAASPVAEHRL